MTGNTTYALGNFFLNAPIRYIYISMVVWSVG